MPAPLEWTRIHPDAGGSRTKCGRYSVCVIGHGEAARWETWRLVPSGPWFTQIALDLASEADARAFAQADADKQP